MTNLALGRNATSQSPAGPAASHDAADGGDKEPEILRWLQVQDVAQKRGCRQQVQKHAVEGNAAGKGQQQKARVGQQLAIALHQGLDLEGLALFGWQRFRQKLDVDGPQHNAHRSQKPEHGLPTQVNEKPATNHRGQCGCNAKEDGDLGHHALRLSRRKNVSHNRTRHHDACAGGQTLQRAKGHQLRDVLRQRTASRGEGEDHQSPENDGAAAKAVCQGAMKQVHEGKAQQIG